jgi:hypothetical protein
MKMKDFICTRKGVLEEDIKKVRGKERSIKELVRLL